MCLFKSAVVMLDESSKGGFKLLISPFTNSHTELCQLSGINPFSRYEAQSVRRFACVEFSPTRASTAHQVGTYKLRIDEDRTPDWFTESMKTEVAKRMAEYVQRIIISDARESLCGGEYILAPSACIGLANHVSIPFMLGGKIREAQHVGFGVVVQGEIRNLLLCSIAELLGGTLGIAHISSIQTIDGESVSIGGLVQSSVGRYVKLKHCGAAKRSYLHFIHTWAMVPKLAGDCVVGGTNDPMWVETPGLRMMHSPKSLFTSFTTKIVP